MKTSTPWAVGRERSSFREARNEVRYPARLPAQMLLASGPLALMTADVSFSGVSIRAEGEAPPLRHLVRLSMVLPTTGMTFVFHAMVVAHRHGPASPDASPCEFGTQLFALDRAARSVWTEFVQYVRTHPGAIGAGSSSPLVPGTRALPQGPGGSAVLPRREPP